MARQYSPKTFIRNVPNELLKQYFSKRYKKFAADWKQIRERDPEPIFDALQKLTDKQRATVDSDFTEINELAYGKGVQAILEEAALWDDDWAESFAEMDNDYARAFWTFLNSRDRFDAAGAFQQMDRYGGGSWWRRIVGKRLEVASEGKQFNDFQTQLRKYYNQQVGSRFCDVEVYRRVDPVRYCFFAYPEDMVTSDLSYDDRGKRGRRRRRSAFEVIFVYRVEEGDLELHARGDTARKEELARIFCTTILGMEGLLEEGQRTPYDLTCLKDPNFPFETEPRDRVLGVELKILRLDLPADRQKGFQRRIQVSATTLPTAPNAVHRLIGDSIDAQKLPLTEVEIGYVRMAIIFRPFESKRETKRLTFEIKYPDHCSLKDDPYDQIAKRCLKRWGIARD